MDIDGYDGINAAADFKSFSFISKGPKGNLVKLVTFTTFYPIPDSYNLALGTVRGENTIDYRETTDNRDRNRILATVFHIARLFLETYPDKSIFIIGRDDATTRLYRAAINHSYADIVSDLLILGVTNTEGGDAYLFESFIQNKRYDAFLFKRREVG